MIERCGNDLYELLRQGSEDTLEAIDGLSDVAVDLCGRQQSQFYDGKRCGDC